MKRGFQMISSNATEKIAKIISQNFKLKVEIYGDQAYTNGKRMVLPNIPEIPDEYKDVFLGLILHEAGHVKFTKHIKMVCEQQALFYNVFEDVRVEQRIEKVFDGAKGIFKQLYEWAEKSNPVTHNDDNIIPVISRHIIRNLRFKQNLLTAIEQPTYDKISHLIRKTTTSEDSAKLALQVAEALGYQKNEEIEQAENQEKSDSKDQKTQEEQLQEKKDELKELEKQIKDKKDEIENSDDSDSSDSDSGDSDSGDSDSGDSDDSDSGDSDSDDSDGSSTGYGSKNSKSKTRSSDNDADEDDFSDDEDDFSDDSVEGENTEKEQLKKELKELKIKRVNLKSEIKSIKELIKMLKKSQREANQKISALSNDFIKQAKTQDLTPQLLKQVINVLYDQIDKSHLTSEKKHIPLTTAFDIVEQLKPDKNGKKGYVSMVKDQITTFTRIVDQALYAKKKTAFSYSKDEGAIDTRALYSYKVNKNTQIFYQQKNKNVRDIAVEILIDLSGSMVGHIEQVKSAGFVISETLTNLNIKHEILGFSTEMFDHKEMKRFQTADRVDRFNRFERLHHFVIKSFDSDDNSPLTNVQANCCNIDGESLAWATNRLLKRSEKRKIIFVLSDGDPNGMVGDVSILRSDLKNTVKLVESTGIQVLALGINGDHCKDFYTDHVELKDKFHNDFCKHIFKYLIEKQNNKPSISPRQFEQLINQYLR